MVKKYGILINIQKGKTKTITNILSIRFPNIDLNDITYQIQHVDDIEFL